MNQFEKSAATLTAIGTELPGLAEACRRVWVETRADGYPTSSLGGGSPTSIVDENGVSMPPLNDPVGELATERPEANRAKAALTQARTLIRSAEKQAEQARAILIAAVHPPTEVDVETPSDPHEWCSVCVRVTRFDGQRKVKILNPTISIESVRGEPPRARCSDCLGWAKMAASDPLYPRERPAALIIGRAEGRRLTTRDVEQAVVGQ